MVSTMIAVSGSEYIGTNSGSGVASSIARGRRLLMAWNLAPLLPHAAKGCLDFTTESGPIAERRLYQAWPQRAA